MFAVRFAHAFPPCRRFLLFLLLLGMVLGVPAAAQEQVRVDRLEISSVETAAFPTVGLNLIATDAQGRRVREVTGLALRENGRPVTEWETTERVVGLDVVFVLDANPSITSIDDDSGRTRLQKTQDSLVRFATQFMDAQQRDHVSVIVPDGEAGRFLVQAATRPVQLLDAVEGYAPETFAATPLQAMMELALTQLETAEPGRYRAIVLFTDGAELGGQLAYDTLVSRAQAAGTPFFVLLLGARADPNEIENVARLYEPAGGYYLHMPNPPDADTLYARLQDNGTQTQLRYHSEHNGVGELRVQVSLAGRTADKTLSLALEPPLVELALTQATIRRAGTAPDTPLENLQPAVHTITAQLTWPGGEALSLTDAVLLVDGQPQDSAETPVVNEDGRLRLEWNISELDEGTYTLAVQVVDSLERVTRSEPAEVTIEVVRPEPPAAAEATPAPSATPLPAFPAVLARFQENPTGLLLAGLGGVFLVALGLLIHVRRRRRTPQQRSPEEAMALLLAELESEAAAEEAQEDAAGAYLVVLQHGPEHSQPILLNGNNITIGRDPRLVQVPLADQSVSRLHARIRRRKGEYWLYDEGSAGGTYLNFERIGLAPHLLQEGDQIQLGRVLLRFHLATESTWRMMSNPSDPAAGEEGQAD